ncbi:hypothetical protein KGR20_13565 [Cytobacillus oceanisediminis]|uniref:hypothetical protein n=1 Tax=Cytobacillus oceanisediminis TaxID=665099 RepID=UPI001CCE76F1|nr:hypothetical protein [Cytobacillus oceanisediminis]MBZ9535269.1 hypothetical protein [Cytobacillus oceanisediminis]
MTKIVNIILLINVIGIVLYAAGVLNTNIFRVEFLSSGVIMLLFCLRDLVRGVKRRRR